MKDKNGKKIVIGLSVEVPEPNKTDVHNFSFVGNVTDILEKKGTVIVEDKDSDFFEIEAGRLEVI
jgi:hypothetical protein